MKRKMIPICLLLGSILSPFSVSAGTVTTESDAQVPVTFDRQSWFSVTFPESVPVSGQSTGTFNIHYAASLSDSEYLSVSVRDDDVATDGIQIGLTGKDGQVDYMTLVPSAFSEVGVSDPEHISRTGDMQEGDITYTMDFPTISGKTGTWSGVIQYHVAVRSN